MYARGYKPPFPGQAVLEEKGRRTATVVRDMPHVVHVFFRIQSKYQHRNIAEDPDTTQTPQQRLKAARHLSGY
jgi:hypothetical protein